MQWQTDRHAVNAFVRYIDSYVDDEVDIGQGAAFYRPIDSQVTLDAQYTLTLQAARAPKLTFGAINLTDEDPPRVQTSGGYDSKVHDPRGRMLYAKALFQVLTKPVVTTPAIALRPATPADVVWLDLWDDEPDVIACSTDDPNATVAFEGIDWADELAMQSAFYQYFIAELDGRPIGAMQICDPQLEETHYWGEIAPNLRAIDIWIGAAADRGKGYGTAMMRLALRRCFADPRVTAIVIDPLASNTRAHEFYRRLGFKPLGRRTFGEDDCLVHELTRHDWLAPENSR